MWGLKKPPVVPGEMSPRSAVADAFLRFDRGEGYPTLQRQAVDRLTPATAANSIRVMRNTRLRMYSIGRMFMSNHIVHVCTFVNGAAPFCCHERKPLTRNAYLRMSA
jgi:hypothetical protein